MKPFDLESALKGEPVKLKNGNKAFIKLDLSDEVEKLHKSFIGMLDLHGYYIQYNNIVPCKWYSTSLKSFEIHSELDIVGMWEDPKPKRYINGIGVPEPLKENEIKNGEYYWYISLMHADNYIKGEIDKQVGVFQNLIRKGLVFKTKEDAKAMAKALFNYKVETK